MGSVWTSDIDIVEMLENIEKWRKFRGEAKLHLLSQPAPLLAQNSSLTWPISAWNTKCVDSYSILTGCPAFSWVHERLFSRKCRTYGALAEQKDKRQQGGCTQIPNQWFEEIVPNSGRLMSRHPNKSWDLSQTAWNTGRGPKMIISSTVLTGFNGIKHK